MALTVHLSIGADVFEVDGDALLWEDVRELLDLWFTAIISDADQADLEALALRLRVVNDRLEAKLATSPDNITRFPQRSLSMAGSAPAPLDLTALEAEVARTETIDGSAEVLIQTLMNAVEANKNNPAALQKMVDRVRAANDALTAAVSAGVGPTGGSGLSVLPSTGVVGDQVTITGTGFGATQGASTVAFSGGPGGVPNAFATSWSDTSLIVAVPPAAVTGPITVTVGGVAMVTPTFTVN